MYKEETETEKETQWTNALIFPTLEINDKHKSLNIFIQLKQRVKCSDILEAL